jgi:hypothetical protein
MNKYVGKMQMINGKWYSVTVMAKSDREAIKKLKVGSITPKGKIEAIKGRFRKC